MFNMHESSLLHMQNSLYVLFHIQALSYYIHIHIKTVKVNSEKHTHVYGMYRAV